MSATTNTVTRRHFPEELNPQLHGCANLNSRLRGRNFSFQHIGLERMFFYLELNQLSDFPQKIFIFQNFTLDTIDRLTHTNKCTKTSLSLISLLKDFPTLLIF
jgi:hypothetical protein